MAKVKRHRNYKREYKQYYGTSLANATPAQRTHRKEKTARKQARRLVEKRCGCKLRKDVDVDHKDGNPQNNRLSNLRVQKRSSNRSSANERGKVG